MTDPADRHLEERLHALARGVSAPIVSTEDDVRRGRRRLLRVRMAMAGATTGTLAVVLGLTSLTAGKPTATEVPPASRPPTSLPATPSAAPAGEARADQQGRPDEGGDTVRGGAAGPGTTATRRSEAEESDGDFPDRVPGQDRPGADAVRNPGAGGVAHGGGTQPTEGPIPSGLPTEVTPSEPADPTQTPSEAPSETPDPTDPPTETPRVRVHRVLAYYNEVLAEHLDPGRDHLQPHNRRTGTVVAARAGGTFYALGSTYRWEAGDVVGRFGIRVASGWDQVDWDCGATYADWDCHISAGDPANAEVAVHGGVREVAVEHADGQVVVLTATGVDSAEDDLVAAAADERLTLPGDAAVSPPRLDATTFAATGERTLVRDEESFEQSSFDRSPRVRGSWSVDDTARSTLAWSARPRYSGATWECLSTYRNCSAVVLDEAGTTVHVAQVRTRTGLGWVVRYDGPSYAVRVFSTDRALPKKRAYAFVTLPDWQVTR